MTIKHIVISGGGPAGLQYLGALEYLHKKEFWKTEEIETIYATSVGAIIAVFLCLKYDWETLNQYIIERPWQDAFTITAKHILDAYTNKGLFDKKLAEIIFKPLLEAKDLTTHITLQELYNYSNIVLHLFTFELNAFKTVELSYKTHPELSLMVALTMSCALPGLFMPVCIENECYMDGGVMTNYPINYCLLQQGISKEEILGVKTFKEETTDKKKNIVTSESTILDFIVSFSINAMNFISNSIQIENIPYEVECKVEENALSLETIKESISNKEMRKGWIQKGNVDGENFLRKLTI